MIGVRMVRRMRFRMNIVYVTVRRDLKQVANGQGQDYARRKHTWESGKLSFHNLGKLTPEASFVNLGKPGSPCWRFPMLLSRPQQARAGLFSPILGPRSLTFW